MKILKPLLKIVITGVIIAVIIHFASAAFLWTSDQETTPSGMTQVQNFYSDDSESSNKLRFESLTTPLLGTTGVALATNLWTKYSQRQSAGLAGDSATIGSSFATSSVWSLSGGEAHMLLIQEYYNILKTDISDLLGRSYNRWDTLDAYIDQLKYRYSLSIEKMKELLAEKNQLSEKMQSASTQADSYKQAISTSFSQYDYQQNQAAIEAFLQSKADYESARTHIIIINQYLKQYQSLNEYNKKLLDTLINNRDAIIKNAYVVIPDTGTEVLQKMNLIISEENYKAQKQEE